MIFEELAKTTKDMQELQRRIRIQQNQEEQNAVDNKFRLLLMQLNKSIDSFEYEYNVLQVDSDNDIILRAVNIINLLEKAIKDGIAVKEDVVNAEIDYKNLQVDLKKKWSSQYNQLTTFTLGTLNVIQEINPEKVSPCINKIQAAKVWENDLKKLQDMKLAIDEAEKLIDNLGLDEDIKTFLNKIRIGKASLADIFTEDNKILNWIKKEGLENKMIISLK